MVNPGDWGAYPSKVLDNSGNRGVIQRLSMSPSQPPRLLDQVRESIRLINVTVQHHDLQRQIANWILQILDLRVQLDALRP
jgi:hypothetical protein